MRKGKEMNNIFNVLIVDDERRIRNGLKSLISWESIGFSVTGIASSGEEAIELIKKKKFHVVITDIKMYQMDGLDLICEAKK